MRELIYKDEAYKAIDNCIRDGWYRISPTDAKMNIQHLVSDVNEADRPQNIIAQITFDEEKLREIVEEAVERFKEEYKIIDRPQGEWIRDRYWSRGAGMGEEYGFFYKCSLCEYEVENGYTRCGFNFCPYCGARMKEINDE